MMRGLLLAVAAAVLTLSSLLVVTTGGERTMYGYEGGVAENFRPREQAGWPAPFLADSPDTSVIHQIGVEDDLRAGNLLGTYAFWLLVVLAARRIAGSRRPLQD
ncbi:hypothetical protein B0I00_0903 [Novosphingobium kunmingense]|uniref:Uncharacterized protein n=1 Tax=Novosphingobium kunmingense TaxID=1211806 RepID=A0A2N0I3E0_9SPHN|nr:hypothetical protein [Novosphingobium kunmingense]PKB25697.1 hypothetical protein B0I00_0903 [Novosphingobium kunmingense]